jgi:hypothetical protein
MKTVLREGAGTGMPTILLGLKTSRHRLGRTDASPKTTPAPKTLLGPPVEMLLVVVRRVFPTHSGSFVQLVS